MITVLISLVVFGGIALYFYQKLTTKSKELQTMQGATTSISEEDINSLLFVLDPDDDTKKNAVMMMRFDPVHKKIFCIGIPLDMQVIFDGKAMTVDTCYINHGMEALKTAIAEAIDQQIDRYIKMDSNGFQKTVELIGNVTYQNTIRDTGLKPIESEEGGEYMEVTLDNTQFETMITSSQYSSEEERSAVIGGSVAQLLNQCIGGGDVPATQVARKGEGGTRVAQNLDTYFGTMVDAVTTDITVMDFSEHRHAISYMFQYSSSPALSLPLNCNANSEGAIVPAESALETIKFSFYQQATIGGMKEEDTESSEEANE